MTDMANAFWNAFQVTMNCTNTRRLLCIWHVDRAWRKKLTLVTNQKERLVAYQQLCLLRTECDQDRFQKTANNFELDCSKKKSTVSFGKYFVKNYMKRSEE